MAAGVIAAATTAGLTLPDELGVVGFDDTRIARMTHPPLTTVRVPMALMGAEALRLLVERLHEPDRRPTRVTLRPEIIVRSSCGNSARSTRDEV
jgi:DNA-binding LacI/PurR family transcriptional regulator